MHGDMIRILYFNTEKFKETRENSQDQVESSVQSHQHVHLVLHDCLVHSMAKWRNKYLMDKIDSTLPTYILWFLARIEFK